MLRRHYYSQGVRLFLEEDIHSILGKLSDYNEFALDLTQKDAWKEQVGILKESLRGLDGTVFFEYSIPRMGRRVDAVLVIGHAVFVIEFKVGEKKFLAGGMEQVWDYALDLKNFHQTSHDVILVPVLIPTEARKADDFSISSSHADNVLDPIRATPSMLRSVIDSVLKWEQADSIDAEVWANGRYQPTPTIIEAAKALYSQHAVEDIMRRDADTINLGQTTKEIAAIVEKSKKEQQKAICFVTGVPGAGKTLVGLDIATQNLDKATGTSSVFLSGNQPLVDVLREALTRDKWQREKLTDRRVRKGDIFGRVKTFIQNVHHFRNTYLQDMNRPPVEHVAIFDEAQRAWNREQTAQFIKTKYSIKGFSYSEPEFLISCMDRHPVWATIVCLVGGGQEINRGEAGITEWIESLQRSFPDWQIYVSPRLIDTEYAAGNALKMLEGRAGVTMSEALHLNVSMRSFRAEHLATMIKNLLDRDLTEARNSYELIRDKYPLVLTRDLKKAKAWLRNQARGSERYGLVVSSKAMRLKPEAIDVRIQIDHVQWFLNDRDDVRSSYYLEDAATEYKVQGLELDWACVTWDADFRFKKNNWENWAFQGSKWIRIHQPVRKEYQKNAYRVLLTRARQGMVIVVPEGDPEDATRLPEFYDETFNYLKSLGLPIL